MIYMWKEQCRQAIKQHIQVASNSIINLFLVGKNLVMILSASAKLLSLRCDKWSSWQPLLI